MKIAFVLPRYGESLGGGAETLCRTLLEAAKNAGVVEEVEVWTTCALDHRTWENALPAGKTVENGIPVSRFPVSERDVSVFLEMEHAIHDGRKLSLDQQMDWLENSVNSQELYLHISEHGQEFDLILFAPYLFATSFWGSLIYPERSVLIPCLHDEAYAYQQVFQVLFSKVRGVIFNANAEKDLMASLYKIADLEKRSAVVGMGFEEPETVAGDELSSKLKEKYPSLPEQYFIYSGRKEEGKNLGLLIEYFEKLSVPNKKLVLIGSGEVSFLEKLPESVVDLGFVSEEDKLLLLAGAQALFQPSVNESFSIVLMEAWQQGTPVIVHGNCPVTREHAVESSGGLYFSNFEEFEKITKLLLDKKSFRNELGIMGREYVKSVYSWEAVLERFEAALNKILALQPGAESDSNVIV